MRNSFGARNRSKPKRGLRICTRLDPILAEEPEYHITVRYSGLSGKGPLSVRISDRGGGLAEVIAPNLAVEGAATDL